MKQYQVPNVSKHLSKTIEQTLSALLNNEAVVRITSGELSQGERNEDGSETWTMKVSIHLQPRTEALKISEESS